MPRGARLDVLGVVQHVMARGIERRDISGDAGDREAFLDRLAAVVVAGEAQLLAWSLLSNHFHLVLGPQKLYLKDLMRRLMTGYAGGGTTAGTAATGTSSRIGSAASSSKKSRTCWSWSATFTSTPCVPDWFRI